MSYIVIEKHGGPQYATIVTNEDGDVRVFDTLNDAVIECDDCQDGQIVEIN